MDAHQQKSSPFKVAILSRGNAAARRDTTPQSSRFVRVFEALAAAGIDARPAIYDEAFADEVRAQLLTADAVLVWVDPIHQGKTREALDPLLREVARRGPWVSAHPDIILKMGVKEVLYRTCYLGWGADTHRYESAAAFRAEFPQPSGRLRRRSARAADRPAVFAAQFALSHACWLLTSPLAGWLGSSAGIVPTLLVLAAITLVGVLIARRIWPANDADMLPHQHPELHPEHPHVQGEPSRHAHAYVIDDLHPRWP